MCAILTNGTQLLFEWMNLSVTYSLTNIKILKRIRKQEERLESNQYHSPGTRVKFRELRLPIAHSPLWLYNMTNTKWSLCLLFPHLYRRFAVRRLARSTCSLLRSFSLCLCRQFVSGMVHSIRFHGFRYVGRRFSRSFVTQHPRAAVLDC